MSRLAPTRSGRSRTGPLEIYALDDVVIGRTSSASPAGTGRPTSSRSSDTPSCQYHHLGVVHRRAARRADGRRHGVRDRGRQRLFDIPAGHDGWVIGDEPWETYDVRRHARRFGSRRLDADERVLATILFTDVVDSTATRRASATRPGDACSSRSTTNALPGRDRPVSAGARSRRPATASSPCSTARSGPSAVPRRWAIAVRASSALEPAGRAPHRRGELIAGGNVRGLAVHAAARVAGAGRPRRSPRPGHDPRPARWFVLGFDDRGEHELKGLEGVRRIFSLVRD